MNIVSMHKDVEKKAPIVPNTLLNRMNWVLKSAQTDFSKSVRLAKTLAPVLRDRTANERYLSAINDKESSIQEKIISVILLGFPGNRAMLPTLKSILINSSDSMRIAASIAIAQMKDGNDDELLSDILLASFMIEKSPDVKKAIRQAIISVMDKKSAKIISTLLHDID